MRLPLIALGSLALVAGASSIDADLATAKADLRKFVAAQEGYFSDHNSYAADIAALKFTASDSIVVRITQFQPNAYAASASVKGNDAASCVYFVGHVATMPKTAKGKVAEAEGGVVCDE
jgi:hypothetical protein